jgi:Putative addiction module component
MSAVERIEEQFRKLTPSEQAEALERLSKSVHGEAEESGELIETLNRRLAEVEAGRVAGVDAFAVLDELSAKHSR